MRAFNHVSGPLISRALYAGQLGRGSVMWKLRFNDFVVDCVAQLNIIGSSRRNGAPERKGKTMAYEIQALGKHGDWDAEYISGDPNATTFNTEQEAQDEIENLRRENPAYTGKYRIIEK